MEPMSDLVWHNQVPLKVSIFAWRLLHDRLPTKSNLVIRDIISSKSCFCVSGCGQVESVQHLFLTCSTFGSLWQLVRSWIGFSGADTQVLLDYFSQFIYSTCGLKAWSSFLQLIWLLCVWVVCNERNNRLFKNLECSMPQLLDKVKFYSFWWLKAKIANFVYGFQRCWSSSFVCLDIG